MATAYARDTDFLSPEHLYPYDTWIRRSGIAKSRIREARQNGVSLPTLKVGKRLYVRGSDGIEFIEKLAALPRT